MGSRRAVAVAVALVLSGIAGCEAAAPTATPNAGGQRPAELALAGIAQLRGPWNAVPFRVPPGIAAAADVACRRDIPDGPRNVQLVVLDARGGGVLQAWFAGPNKAALACYDLGLQEDGTIVPGGAGMSTNGGGAPEEPLLENEIRVMDRAGVGGANGGVASSFMAGRVGAAIAVVIIEAPGFPAIRATVSNGWFGAWRKAGWPKGTAIVGLNVFGLEVSRNPLPS